MCFACNYILFTPQAEPAEFYSTHGLNRGAVTKSEAELQQKATDQLKLGPEKWTAFSLQLVVHFE